MSLDEKKEKTEWRKHDFESEMENTYDIIIHNCMSCIHGNKVNKLAQCNLLHDILNHPKYTKKTAITILFYKDAWIHKNVKRSLRTFKSYWIVDVVPQL